MSYKLENSKFFSSIFSLEFVFSLGNSSTEKANHLNSSLCSKPTQDLHTLKVQVLCCCHVFSKF